MSKLPHTAANIWEETEGVLGMWHRVAEEDLPSLCSNERIAACDHKDVGIWPEDLHSLAASKPVTAIASMVGVSEAAVRKRLKKLGIETRPPGYWSKHKLGKR